MDYAKEALRLHAKWNGKLETVPKMKIENRDDLSIAYTPGVAEPCKVIAEDKMPDLNCFTVESAMRLIAGTARSMGITVTGEFPANN